MTEEIMRKLIREKISEFDYKSVKAQFALLKEEETWKILMSRFIFEKKEPVENKTLIKKENFVLEEFSLPVFVFDEFLRYTERGYISVIKIENGKPAITDHHLYGIGDYDLCMVGNFPSRELYFYGRKSMNQNHGIDHPTYYVDWSIHSSVVVTSQLRLELIDHDPPFRDYVEAINHYWGTDFERYGGLHGGCHIYFPIYEASIESCEVQMSGFRVHIETNEEYVKNDDLTFSVIANNEKQKFRRKYPVTNEPIEDDIGFVPQYATFFLHMGDKKLDQFEFYKPQPISIQQNVVGLEESKDTFDEIYLFDDDLLSTTPKQVRVLLEETQKAFKNNLYRSSAILLRVSLDELLTVAIRRMKKDELLFKHDGYEVGLLRKIDIVTKNMSEFRTIGNEMDVIKTFGDRAAHEGSLPFYKTDITDNLGFKMRLILSRYHQIFTKHD